MIAIQGIDHVALNVRDIDKSVAFYTKVLGLKVTQREPSKPGIEYFLDCGPSLLGIIQANNFDNAHPFANEGLGANHFSFRVHAKDFDALVSQLEKNSVRIEFAKKRDKSWSLYFYDLDGNKLEATAWPREDGLASDQIKKVIYNPATKTWNPYSS
jgi:catechol 2,3-dioxygenase-like lactoylglutathione lyase family enzyme